MYKLFNKLYNVTKCDVFIKLAMKARKNAPETRVVECGKKLIVIDHNGRIVKVI